MRISYWSSDVCSSDLSLQALRGLEPTLPSRRIVIAALGGLLLAGSVSAGPVYHKLVMQGQVLSVDGDTLVVCIGKEDGAEVGQELKLVRHVRTRAAPKAGGPGFRREVTGRSEERRVGTECVSTGRSRGWP